MDHNYNMTLSPLKTMLSHSWVVIRDLAKQQFGRWGVAVEIVSNRLRVC